MTELDYKSDSLGSLTQSKSTFQASNILCLIVKQEYTSARSAFLEVLKLQGGYFYFTSQRDVIFTLHPAGM